MFGFVQANMDALSESEKQRYRSVYCGLCHALGKRHGLASRFGLTYDMTFLALLLSSLYEPVGQITESRCIAHPVKEHTYVSNKYIDYAADMTVALVYFKCEDDWKDDKNIFAKSYSSLLSNAYKKVKIDWPRQCETIERELNELSCIEAENSTLADAAANSFGRLMEELFVYSEDIWAGYLRKLGYGLGRYIYMADAAVDLPKDLEKGSYNPLKNLSSVQNDMRPRLELLLGEASDNFEKLPIVQDENILKNILYSGIWTRYEYHLTKNKGKTK